MDVNNLKLVMKFQISLILFFIQILQILSNTNVTVNQPNPTENMVNCPPSCMCLQASLHLHDMEYWLDPNTTGKLFNMLVCAIKTADANTIKLVPSNTEILTLKYLDNQEIVITEDYLAHLNNLQGLEIGVIDKTHSISGHIKISNNALTHLQNLKYLSLNGLEELGFPRNVGKFLDQLRFLSISKSNMPALTRGMFHGLQNLETLHLFNNGIQALADLAFEGAINIQNLSLDRNNLTSFSAHSFAGMPELKYLNLSYNQIRDLTGLAFSHLGNLHYLDLSHNIIHNIFPYTFYGLNFTDKIQLGGSLYPIHIMPLSFYGLLSLKHLSLPHVNNDYIEESMFHGLPSLTTLTISGKISKLKNHCFSGLDHLRRLTLKNCQIQDIEDNAFHDINELHTLDLSGNNIKILSPDVFEPLFKLQDLELQDNHLQVLSFGWKHMTHLQSLRLDNNPWHCDCHFYDIKDTLITTIKKHKKDCNTTNICNNKEALFHIDIKVMSLCYTPEIYRNKTVIEVAKIQQPCDIKSQRIFI